MCFCNAFKLISVLSKNLKCSCFNLNISHCLSGNFQSNPIFNNIIKEVYRSPQIRFNWRGKGAFNHKINSDVVDLGALKLPVIWSWMIRRWFISFVAVANRQLSQRSVSPCIMKENSCKRLPV